MLAPLRQSVAAATRAFSSSARTNADIARLNLVGRLGKDATVAQSQSGNQNIRLVVGTGHKGSDGEQKTSWHNIIVPGQQATVPFLQTLPKGSLVHIEADYFNEAVKRDDGTYDSKIMLLARSVDVLSVRKATEEASADAPREIP